MVVPGGAVFLPGNLVVEGVRRAAAKRQSHPGLQRRPRHVRHGPVDPAKNTTWMSSRSPSTSVRARIIERIRQKALRTGAVDAVTLDARNLFVDCFVFPALMAGAVYEGKYPLATALGRPLIAKLMVDTARQHNASAVAHGCTGKGNDQVRFDVTFQTLAPDLKIIAPVREWKMTRDEEIRSRRKHGIPVEATMESPYSIDQNLWGRSCEAGVLEDPWDEPPADGLRLDDRSGQGARTNRCMSRSSLSRAGPSALDGQKMDGVPLIEKLNKLGGEHGVGRIDHVENRLVGIKSRELYEAPAESSCTTPTASWRRCA